MSIPRRFHRLHPSVPPASRSGRYGSRRCVVLDYRFCLFAPAVHNCLHRYTDTGSAVCLRCFPESSAARPTGRWCGCMACRHGPAGVFQSAGRGHRRRSRSVQYGSAVRYTLRSGGVRHRNGNTGYCRQFVCAGMSVFVVAVFQSAEAEQLIKADQVLVAVFFTVSLYNDIYANIALSNFILIKIKIILIKYLYSCILPILLLIQKIIFFKIINHSLY